MSFTSTYITPRAWRASEHARTRDRHVRIDDVLMSPQYPELRSDYGRGGRYSRRYGRTAFRHVIEMEALYSTDRACLEPGVRDRWDARAEMLHGVLDRGCEDVLAYQAPHFVRMCDERAAKHIAAGRRSYRGDDLRYHRRLAMEWSLLARRVAERLDQLGWQATPPVGPVYYVTPAFAGGGGGASSGGGGGSSRRRGGHGRDTRDPRR